ncbi:MAG: tetratricopeptide repeat protein [Methylacidiphilales bacterium]|nr:tetratricopeptide repeat protein [Candidatus Methylacidiphilales bacterium]
MFGWCSVLSAQTTDVPVAHPASAPATPPVAQPVNPAPGTTNAVGGLVVTSPAEARFESAMGSFNAGQYVDAVQSLSDFVRDFPQDRHREEALYRLAEAYRNLGHNDDALAAYTFQVQLYPDGPLRINGELRRGALLFDAGKFSDAATPLQFVADKGDGELQQAAKYLLGRTFLATQKETDGRALLQALADALPPGRFAGGAAQALAELDDAENKPAESLPLWEKALAAATDPATKATAAARGGWAALETKQPAEAEKLFQTARQFDPNGEMRKVANTGLLRLLIQQKRFSEWLALYTPEKGNVLASAQEEILYDLAHAQFSLKHWAEAIAAFDAYLAAYPAQEMSVTAAYERFLAQTQVDRAQTVSAANAYLQAWPKSPYRPRVQLLEAQELSREKKFSDALPLWEGLAQEKGDADWPHREILFELARTYDQLQNWTKAAASYQAYLDENGKISARRALEVQARLAVCLQRSNRLLAATDAWKAVQATAPEGSPEQQMALESLGLIYSRGGPPQEAMAVATFRALLEKFPQSPLRALAAFSVGDSLFKSHDYAGAEPFLVNARNWDAKNWMQPATQRLVLGAYGLKDYDQTIAYMKEYDTLPVPANSQAQVAARLPAALFYWLGETARKAGKWDDAAAFYLRVTQHPDPGDLLAGAWWQLGEVQGQQQQWAAAAGSYEKYRVLKPEAKDATVVLLALGRAELGAQKYDQAKAVGQQALLQEPEGPNSAAARMLLAEVAFATRSYAEAARMFATLAVLFDDPKITPQAISRAADSFEAAGDDRSAAEWRQKLKDKYPQFQPLSYL